MRVLVAGVGNVLRGDDGFGVVVAHRLMREPLPEDVRVLEVGIGGIHLVQELFEPFEALVVIDAIDTGRPPGSVVVMRPEVLDVAALSPGERQDQLADLHYATPERAFMLAAALDRLPASTWLVGGQPSDSERYGEGLSPSVAAAIEPAMAEVRLLVSELGVAWATPAGFPQARSGRPAARKEVSVDEERKTEQHDELSEEHSIAAKEHRPENPYRPARQPAQEQPDEEEDEQETGY